MPVSESFCRTGCRQEKGKEKKKKDGLAGAGKKWAGLGCARGELVGLRPN